MGGEQTQKMTSLLVKSLLHENIAEYEERSTSVPRKESHVQLWPDNEGNVLAKSLMMQSHTRKTWGRAWQIPPCAHA